MSDFKLNFPVAKKISHQLEKHGDIRQDDYFWLRDRENQEVIDHLNAENDFYEEGTKEFKVLKETLFQEMKARIKEDDESVPYKFNGYWYLVKYRKGESYPIYSRKKETLEAKEEILFDCNEMAKGHDYFNLTGLSVSPDNNLISFGTDTVGRRNYTLQIKNLGDGKIYPDTLENTTGSAAWANDNSTLFYTRKDETTLRSDKIYMHRLGEESSDDSLVFNELDDTFGVTVYKTKSRKYIVIACYSTLTNEFHVLNADEPTKRFRTVQKRILGLEYSISHYQDSFYILTNADDAYNFKLMKSSEDQTEIEHWTEVIPHRNDTLLEDIDIFKDFLVVSERRNGLNEIRISAWDGSQDYYLPFNNETYTAYTNHNVEFDTHILRYNYNSLTTPTSVIDFNMKTKEFVVMKEQEVLGGKFDKENYTSERLWATSEDGIKIPISLVYRKDTILNSETPLLQYAYGSYGHTIDPYFSTIRLSLLDRGFVYAISHLRGGEYLGRPWYEDGKLLNKKNTFNDFISCSKFLIERGYTSSQHLYAQGGSAGGLLMGVIVNEAAGLYNGIIAAVPFVDVISTMLDDTIPLTTGEYDEWGNPNEKVFYDYMKSYSPYDNVKPQEFPNMLVTSGLHDSQVQYWEPTKWVAKIREMKLDENQLFLKTNMKAGHGGASGRFDSLREDAEEFAFLLALEKIYN
ncbi:oligopeptidase B [Flavobacteriaceae bacterium MAR_2010_188]|nr:oligopeptidase B [Flavobacteriaceae bacterium MAR_2010_188]